jgi:kynurenine formamidase
MAFVEEIVRARIFDLEQPRYFGMPIFPAHRPGFYYALHRRHRDSYQPDANGPRTSASGVLTMMEHSGTHIDALCHQASAMRLHGNLPVEEFEGSDGFRALGAETIPLLMCRGVLLDVAAWKGEPVLPADYSISADELQACASAANVEVRKGDVLVVRTGYGGLWHDESRYLNCAGVGKSGSIWAAERGVRAVAADNMAWDAIKDRDPETRNTLFGHAYLLATHGVYILENLNLEELSANRVSTFFFVAIPLKLRGATGSPIRPLAIVEQ